MLAPVNAGQHQYLNDVCQCCKSDTKHSSTVSSSSFFFSLLCLRYVCFSSRLAFHLITLQPQTHVFIKHLVILWISSKILLVTQVLSLNYLPSVICRPPNISLNCCQDKIGGKRQQHVNALQVHKEFLVRVKLFLIYFYTYFWMSTFAVFSISFIGWKYHSLTSCVVVYTVCQNVAWSSPNSPFSEIRTSSPTSHHSLLFTCRFISLRGILRAAPFALNDNVTPICKWNQKH